MKFLFGLVMVIACVLGGYLAAGGALLALWQPFELVIILGGSIGAFIIANTPKVIKESVAGILGLFKGAKYKKQVYIDLLGLMYALFSKSRKEGLMALESDIEEPEQSEIFKTYPKLAANHHLIDFICY